MTFSSSMNEVMVTISVSVRSALIREIAVMPSMFGIRRSIRTTSGSSRRAIAHPPRSRRLPRRPLRCPAGDRRTSSGPSEPPRGRRQGARESLTGSSTRSPAAGLPAIASGVGVTVSAESSKGRCRSGQFGTETPAAWIAANSSARAEGFTHESVGAAPREAILERVRPAHDEDPHIRRAVAHDGGSGQGRGPHRAGAGRP